VDVSTVMARLHARMDRWIPASIHDGPPEDLRLARLMLLMSGSTLMWALLFIPLPLALGAPMVAFLVITASMAAASVGLVLWHTESAQWSARVLLSALVWVLGGSAFALDGPSSPSLFWLFVMPLVAVTLLGRKEAIAWTAFLAFIVTTLIGLRDSGLSPFLHELEGWKLSLYWVAAAVSGLILQYCIGLSYDASKDAMKKELEDTRDEAREAHRAARLVLDHVDEGLMILDADGRVGPQSSATTERLLGRPDPGQTVWELIARWDPAAAEWLSLGWEGLTDGFLPLDVVLDQLPTRCQGNGCTLQLRFIPMSTPDPAGGDPRFDGMVVAVADISAALVQERAEAEQRELLALFQQLLKDPAALDVFVEAGASLVHGLGSGDRTEQMRAVHTLKGNASMLGLASISSICHEVEQRLVQGDAPEEAGVPRVVGAWEQLERQIQSLRQTQDGQVRVSAEERQALRDAIAQHTPHHVLLEVVDSWSLEPAKRPLARIGQQAVALAERLDKPGLSVLIDAGELRTDPDLWRPLWAALTHLVRNAVDHGIEHADERVAAGKPMEGRLTLRLVDRGHEVALRIEDDGRGIDWSAVRTKAETKGLPAATHHDLIEALFADGLTTRESASQTSGRGVGMAAVRAAAASLGGRMEVQSEQGKGTTWFIVFSAELVWTTPSLAA